MRVLMLGWEFPPFIAGGLGTACYGLTRALNHLGTDVLFVLPKPIHAPGAANVALAGPKYEHPQSHLPPAQRSEPPQHVPDRMLAVPPQPAPAEVPTAGSGDATGSIRAATGGESLADRRAPVAGPHTVFTPANLPQLPPKTPQIKEFERVTFQTVDALLSPYMTPTQYQQVVRERYLAHVPATPTPASGPSTSAMTGSEPVLRAPTMPPADARPVAASPISSPAFAPPASIAPAPATPAPSPAPTQVLPPAAMNYAKDLLTETQRYADLASAVARQQTFDVIHAHDWMTYRAGLTVAQESGKPLVVHVHSTEYDRAGQNLNPEIVAIERAGFTGATRIIAVSHLTKRLLIARYGVPGEKIEVIHNAIDLPPGVKPMAKAEGIASIRKDEKIVLFLGRLTAQKGPEYFLAAARKVLDVYEPVKFIIAGSGDLIHPMIELAAAMGIGHKVLFTGFLNSREVEQVFRMADLFVMTSVSEPFGIAPLEALAHDVPVIISKQSGVSEVLDHALKVDFWDTDELANKILAVLRHPALAKTLRKNAKVEIRKMSWKETARRVMELYEQLRPAPVVADETPVAPADVAS